VSLRLKLVVALVALSALATAAIGLFSYRTTRQQLLGEIDASLEATVAGAFRDGRFERPERPGEPDRFRGPGESALQLVLADGAVVAVRGATLPVTEFDRSIAASDRPVRAFREASADDEPYRILTQSDGSGVAAVQAGRSLAETQRVLDTLRTRIVVASLVVMAVAAVLGWLIARQVTRRLVRLTAAAEEVSATQRLDVDVPVTGTDETGRLGTAFNGMLHALARSKEDQQRLVQDAGHELRTPLTSLRTNVYALRRADRLSPEEHRRLLDDVEGETVELSRLVNEVIELATDRFTDEAEVLVELGPLLERVAGRVAQRTGRVVTVAADGSTVVGRPLALERAVGNLIENACKFDDSGGPIEVTCAAGAVDVADRGPGISEEDLPHVFDRFYRSTAARSRPGSGLGLAIVRDVVERHGGTVVAADRPGGGAVVGFRLPPAPAGPPTPAVPTAGSPAG
jgi:two-component system sensor histidine kinase MprB